MPCILKINGIYSAFNIEELLDSWNERARYSVNLDH